MGDESRKMRVLVVDEQLVADTLVLILEKAGVRAKAAYNSGQAMALTSVFGPDALIAASMLDGMSGFDLSRQIARNSPGCRTLLFSEQPRWADEQAEETAACGIATVEKPVHPRVILDWLGCAAPFRPQPIRQIAGVA